MVSYCVGQPADTQGVAWSMYPHHEVPHIGISANRPLNYDCAVRKVALEYATKLAADPTTARSAVDVKTVYDALALERDCENTAWETAAAQLAAAKAAHSSAMPSPTAAPEQPRRYGLVLYVDADTGSDGNVGSISQPFQTLAFAVLKAKTVPEGARPVKIVLREGTYRADQTISFVAGAHNNLTITSYEGEDAQITGDKAITTNWKQVGSTPDGSLPIWVADLSGQGDLGDFVGLRFKGGRVTRARYPNSNPELEQANSTYIQAWTSPQNWTGPLATETAETMTSIAPNRLEDTGAFGYYTIGTGGPCAVYSPPESYWCSNRTSGGGAFPFRVPSGVALHANAIPGIDTWNDPVGDGAVLNNATMAAAAAPPSEGFSVPILKTILEVRAHQSEPLLGLQLINLTFAHAAATYFDPHGVPSGGDWALQRSGALFFEGVKGLNIEGCKFTRLDGIALMLSGYARATTIKANTFQWIGDSAMAAWGYTANVSTSSGVMVEGYDGTGGNQPRGTLVDRQAFLTDVANPLAPSMTPAYNEINNNYLIANYESSMCVDNDDGSAFYRIHDNVCAYGGHKSDFDGHHKYTYNSLDIFPKKDACLSTMPMFSPDGVDAYYNNTCMMLGEGTGKVPAGKNAGPYASFSACQNRTLQYSEQLPSMHNNTVFLDASKYGQPTVQCKDFLPPWGMPLTVELETWQKMYKTSAVGSVVHDTLPTPDEMAQMARAILGLESPDGSAA
eukprot:gene7088-18000_t